MKKKSIYTEELFTKIKDLVFAGELRGEIALKLGLTIGQMDYITRYFNIKSNMPHALRVNGNTNMAVCRDCKLEQFIENFRFLKRDGKFKQTTYCHQCASKLVTDYVNSSDKIYVSVRYNQTKTSAKRKNIPFTITKQQFIDQYNSQNGLCFYTDKLMLMQVGKGVKNRSDSFSVDKIIPEKGYVLGNVVFCANKINSCKNDLSIEEIKQWMPGWHERIMKFINYV